MKLYDRKTNRWVEEKELEARKKHRDKDVCRGQKPHNYVLVLPDYVEYDGTYNFKAEEYYKIMETVRAFEDSQQARLAKLGIKTRYWSHPQSKLFMCSVCHKKKYLFAK